MDNEDFVFIAKQHFLLSIDNVVCRAVWSDSYMRLWKSREFFDFFKKSAEQGEILSILKLQCK